MPLAAAGILQNYSLKQQYREFLDDYYFQERILRMGVVYLGEMGEDFFTGNRQSLIGELGAELVVLTGFTVMQWHGDTAVPFRQDANFWYLTGIEQPDWRLIIDGRQGKSWLVAPETDAVHEIFDGSLDFATAKKISGVDEVVTEKASDQLLKDLVKKHQTVYTLGAPGYLERAGFVPNPAPEVLKNELNQMFSSVKHCHDELARLRAIKQPAEVEIMNKAANITAEALELVRSKMLIYEHEYEVEADITHKFRHNNATHAFEPIVAHGKNACTLHYVANSDKLQRAQLLLMDIGARVNSYSADVTRTFSLGEASQRQKAVHAAVQSAERQIIELLRPGLSLKSYLEQVDAIMREALLSLGLMKNMKDDKGYRRYFPHAISHGLGLDVHESLGGYEELQPGMVLTVEPGIYIPEEGIGVRIEDSILVTETGHDNLTANLSTDM